MFEESKVDGWLAALCAEILTSRLTPLLRMTAEKGCAPPQDDREKRNMAVYFCCIGGEGVA